MYGDLFALAPNLLHESILCVGPFYTSIHLMHGPYSPMSHLCIILMLCSHLTSAFVSMSMSKINIASVVAQSMYQCLHCY